VRLHVNAWARSQECSRKVPGLDVLAAMLTRRPTATQTGHPKRGDCKCHHDVVQSTGVAMTVHTNLKCHFVVYLGYGMSLLPA
jgi:hypothetical protein